MTALEPIRHDTLSHGVLFRCPSCHYDTGWAPTTREAAAAFNRHVAEDHTYGSRP